MYIASIVLNVHEDNVQIVHVQMYFAMLIFLTPLTHCILVTPQNILCQKVKSPDAFHQCLHVCYDILYLQLLSEKDNLILFESYSM